MKKILIISLIFLGSLAANAQKISNLKPTFVVWQKGRNNISLNDAKFGVVIKDSISLSLFFNNHLFETIENYENTVLEFRWYYYLSTRKSLMYIDKVNYKEALKQKDAIVYSSSYKSLRPGWWEVQVISSTDKGFLQFGSTMKYQIFVKK